MDLMKPSERAERDFDALGDYHKPTEQTGGSMADGVGGNWGETWGNIFFESHRLQLPDPGSRPRAVESLIGETLLQDWCAG